jgi:thymidylate synthase (FAD)
MKIVEPSYQILTPIDGPEVLRNLESIARTCYKSEDKITRNSAVVMLSSLLKNGHEAMIEFFDITVKFIHNRGFSHEMVRHRLCSFAQESTRYCNYSADKFGNEITVISPYWKSFEDHQLRSIGAWKEAMDNAQKSYFALINSGLQPQAARGVLPNDLKTEIVVKANLREWRAIFELRCAPAAHPDMRRVMIPLLRELQERIPVIFDAIHV